MSKISKKQQQIIETAEELFFRHGIKRVTVEEICQKASVSKMTFYKYFANKNDLAEHIILRIFEQVEEKLSNLEDDVDYVTFVPDGEPTLDVNLGNALEAVNRLGVKTAVICNSSLIWMEDVRNDLCKADWVSLKVDAVTDEMWRRVDRPHGMLSLESILDGLLVLLKSIVES